MPKHPPQRNIAGSTTQGWVTSREALTTNGRRPPNQPVAPHSNFWSAPAGVNPSQRGAACHHTVNKTPSTEASGTSSLSEMEVACNNRLSLNPRPSASAHKSRSSSSQSTEGNPAAQAARIAKTEVTGAQIGPMRRVTDCADVPEIASPTVQVEWTGRRTAPRHDTVLSVTGHNPATTISDLTTRGMRL